LKKSTASFPRLPKGGLPMATTRLFSTGKNRRFLFRKSPFLIPLPPGAMSMPARRSAGSKP